jgi:hypothetical protein
VTLLTGVRRSAREVINATDDNRMRDALIGGFFDDDELCVFQIPRQSEDLAGPKQGANSRASESN